MNTQMSMLRLCTLDPSKYGWTAIGGISSNLLVPHEMARRPEARDKYLKQQTTAAASASSDPDHPNADGNADTSSKYYTISDPSSSNAAISTTATSALTDEVNNAAKKSTTTNALKEIVIHATSTTTPTSTTSIINTIHNSHNINATTADNDNIHQPPSSFSSKPSPISQTNTTPTTPSIASSPTPTTATTVAAVINSTKLDIYTYHRGRVGQEPRNPTTGELLCDMDPIDTNYGWVPSKNAVCKVTINFPLGDLNDDDTDDDIEEEGIEEKGELKCGRSRYKNGGGREGDEESKRSDSRRRGAGGDDDISWFIERNVRSSRSRSTMGVGGGGGSLVDVPASQFPTHTTTTSSASTSSTMPHTNHYPQLPRFVQVIEWDLANPHTPTPEVYATNIASEFGLTFPQTMDLMESIERQLRSFCDNQPMFYAPMAILDPYGCERPDAHFGPPEIYCGPVLSSANATGGGGGGSRPYVVRRLNSNQSTGGGSFGGGGGSSSNSRRGGGGSSASRPPGAIKPDKRGIQVVPKDQLILPNKDGDVYVAEVLQRAKCRSMAMVMECGKNGEESLTITKNDVCHICHNRKERGLTFHCGVHNYCDFHCATRLGFRVDDYDSNQPLNVPINFCPVCTLMCTCSKCSRRLEDVSGLLKKESQKQNVGPKETVMDNLYDLCSFKLRHDVNVSAIPSTSSASGTQRSNKSKGSSKKTKSEQKKESKGEGKNAKRRNSSESVVSADFADDDGQQKTSSRSMRSSPSSDAVFDERPPKKRKLENPTAFVSVLKVPPSAFPKEMCCGEDLDPSTPEDIEKIFLPDGALPNEFVAPLLGTSQKYQALIPPFMSESHFFQCAECSLADGELVVCKTCPRAYHKKCLAISSESFVDDNDGGDATTSLSGILYRHLKCPCHRCECDQKVLDSETEPPETNRTESQNYRSVGTILCELQHILNKLIEYDFGLIFATPVNPNEVTDYLQVITKPMDYGTILSKLETRQYVASDGELSKMGSGVESLNDMEKMLLQAVMDVLQVHHNCFLYNPEGSSFYRAGKVQERKWNAYFNKLKKGSFPDFVLFQLLRFKEECETERERTVRSRHFEANNPEKKKCKPIAVFDPDTKRIVKQYSSKVSARNAAMILSNMGYVCENELTLNSVKSRLDNAEDPTKPLFGYQWISTANLKSGLFEIKPYFRSDDLVSPTPYNIVVLKADAVPGNAQLQRGFESEEAAYSDWLREKSRSFTTSTSVDEQDGSEESRSDFLSNYLDGTRSINGIVWNRVDSKNIDVAPILTSKSTGKVVTEEEHAQLSPIRK